MIARKTWREVRFMALVYGALLLLLDVPVIMLWPELYDELRTSSLVRNLPFDLGSSIGKGVTDSREEIAYRNWIAVMLYFRAVNLLGIAASVLMGTALFARERETQTLEFLLTRTVSRRRILWEKCWPTVVCVVVPIFLVNWSAIFLSRAIELELPWAPVTLASLHACLFVLAILALTTFVSVQCRVQAHVAFWVGGIVVMQIGIYLVPRLRKWSLFRLSDFDWYGPILAGNVGLRGMFDPVGALGFSLWLVLAIVLFYWLALRALERLEP
jgi:ABC-type transport system involved in multi-copper enzyme maturation permease subunit